MENQKKIKSRIGKLIEYFKFGIWRERIDSLPKSKARIINFARVILLALRGYKEDKCQLKASALTFYSLLSMVPIVAMIFGIAKGFGIEKMLEEQLECSFEGQEEVL
ncbi:MAG: YihY/virulence factor BrkB family protein, partial [Marinilabiliales bacterium]